MAIDLGNIYDYSRVSPNEFVTGNSITGGDSGMLSRMLLGGSPTSGDVRSIGGTIIKGVRQGLFGQNDFTPDWYRINEDAANRDYFSSLQGRDYQTALQGDLAQAINGYGPSVAQQQMQQGVGRALADIPSIANSARGVNRGLAQRTASLGGMLAAQQANRDASILRAQEQLQARQQFADVAQQQRQQDLAARQQDVGIEQANQQAYGAAQGQRAGISEGNAERAQKGTSGLMNTAGAALGALMSDMRAKTGIEPLDTRVQQLDWSQLVPQSRQSSVESGAPGLGSALGSLLGGGGGTGGMLSDRSQKDGIERTLGELDGFRYHYREPVARRMAMDAARMTYDDAMRDRMGVMAQDMEDSPMGKRAVLNTPTGKALEIKRSLGVALAGVADLDKRLARIERAA